jgi:hypothetical protein
MKPSNFFKLS